MGNNDVGLSVGLDDGMVVGYDDGNVVGVSLLFQNCRK